MSAPTQQQTILQPPHPGMHQDIDVAFKFNYELWERSGGYTPAITNLKGLQASVAELNTLVGINTEDTVQDQLNLKANTVDLGSIASQDADSVAITGGTLETTFISKSNITIEAGGIDLPIGATLHSDTTPVGNIGIGEDTLITYSMNANTLVFNGNYLEILAWGITAPNANNKRIKLKIGSTILLDTGLIAANAASWFINTRLIRTAASVEQSIASILSNSSLIIDSATYTEVTENTAAILDIFCTGEAINDDDIVQKGLLIKWYK
jgi:hypothetical protein